MDVELSPSSLSLGGTCVGRGRIPLHGPTIGKSIRPWHRQSRVLREPTWNKSHNARLSILILNKAYPVHGILSHVTRLMKALMVLGIVFSGKATKSRSLISYFSFQVLVDYPF
jgi:hypothetical protein